MIPSLVGSNDSLLQTRGVRVLVGFRRLEDADPRVSKVSPFR